MNTVFFDLEWNTGFLDGSSFDEVIEIGAVKVNERYERIDGFHRLVRPLVYRKMNPYIQKIISVRMADLRGEDPLDAVAADFFRWCGDAGALIAWSTNDFGVLERNLERFGMVLPEQFDRYDLQAAYAYRTEHTIHSYSLKAAVEAMSIPAPEDHVFHDAYYDAQYTAAIGKKLYEAYGPLPTREELDTFRATQVKPKKPKIPLKYSVKHAIRMPEHCQFQCPVCGDLLHLKSWYVLDPAHFISRVKCRNDDTYYAELVCDRFRHATCDSHFTLWGENNGEAARRYEAAQELDHEIRLYGSRNKHHTADATPQGH